MKHQGRYGSNGTSTRNSAWGKKNPAAIYAIWLGRTSSFLHTLPVPMQNIFVWCYSCWTHNCRVVLLSNHLWREDCPAKSLVGMNWALPLGSFEWPWPLLYREYPNLEQTVNEHRHVKSTFRLRIVWRRNAWRWLGHWLQFHWRKGLGFGRHHNIWCSLSRCRFLRCYLCM